MNSQLNVWIISKKKNYQIKKNNIISTDKKNINVLSLENFWLFIITYYLFKYTYISI